MGFFHCAFDLLDDNDCLAVTFYPTDHFSATRQYFRDIGSLDYLFVSFCCMQLPQSGDNQPNCYVFCLYLPLALASLAIYDCLPF